MTKQSGFTLVEIAIVLVIVGLILVGVVKGQELVNSARVRGLAEMSSGIQAAYFGFVDRFRQVPGDMNAALATQAIGQAIVNPAAAATVGNGQIDAGNWDEASAAWEHLSKAGFIQGAYPGAAPPRQSHTRSRVWPRSMSGTALSCLPAAAITLESVRRRRDSTSYWVKTFLSTLPGSWM